ANIFSAGFSTEFDELKQKQYGDAQAVADSLDLGQLDLGEEDAGIPISPAIYFFHPDHLGSSTVITDGMGYAYQIFLNLPFGETMAEQRRSGTFTNVFKFNGKELDTETGLYYYGARYYNPRISNWLSVDPEFSKFPSWSPYNYTLQNPIRFIDPDGRSPLDIIFRLKVGKNGGNAVLRHVKFEELPKSSQDAFLAFAGSYDGKEFLSNFIDGSQTVGGLELNGFAIAGQDIVFNFDDGKIMIDKNDNLIPVVGTTDYLNNPKENSFRLEINVDKRRSTE